MRNRKVSQFIVRNDQKTLDENQMPLDAAFFSPDGTPFKFDSSSGGVLHVVNYQKIDGQIINQGEFSPGDGFFDPAPAIIINEPEDFSVIGDDPIWLDRGFGFDSYSTRAKTVNNKFRLLQEDCVVNEASFGGWDHVLAGTIITGLLGRLSSGGRVTSRIHRIDDSDGANVFSEPNRYADTHDEFATPSGRAIACVREFKIVEDVKVTRVYISDPFADPVELSEIVLPGWLHGTWTMEFDSLGKFTVRHNNRLIESLTATPENLDLSEINSAGCLTSCPWLGEDDIAPEIDWFVLSDYGVPTYTLS